MRFLPFRMRVLLSLLTVLLSGCTEQAVDHYPGYAEAEYVRLASPVAGTLAQLLVQRGDTVAANAPAFVLEQDSERAAREEAEARVQRAQAQLANLKKGKRPDEIAALQAQLSQAKAALQLSSASLDRQRKLVAEKFVSPARLDEARAAVARDLARVNETSALLRVARLGARSDEIGAAGQELKAAEAQLMQAQWRLEQKTQRVPVAATVDDVLYREGEFVPAGSPVISLLPPQNIKARFFVPENMLGTLRIGQELSLHCDGCGKPVAATISFIANAPEYTSPIIYSRENRATMVFMVEARPAAAQAFSLHPGQPLEVHPVTANKR